MGITFIQLEFYRKFYDDLLVTQPSWQLYILEQLPAVFAILHFSSESVEKAILTAVNFGRDNDTIGCMVGELLGTMRGASSLSQDWVNTVLSVNPVPDMKEIAQGFVDLICKDILNESHTS